MENRFYGFRFISLAFFNSAFRAQLIIIHHECGFEARKIVHFRFLVDANWTI